MKNYCSPVIVSQRQQQEQPEVGRMMMVLNEEKYRAMRGQVCDRGVYFTISSSVILAALNL
jgi:hypothetical protein